jgi:single-stranded-DNA-specific exonuclease
VLRWEVKSEFDRSRSIVEQILENRGIVSEEEKKAFLNPPAVSEFVSKLPNEFKVSLKNAKDIVGDAMRSELPIIIHGDYDADGISATAILYKTLKNELKYEHTYYFIPNRFDHGYGLSTESIDEVIKMLAELGYAMKDGGLFITVDSGITAVEPVNYIKSLGFKVIITDHHQRPEDLPEADCIVWYDQVVGSSIAWLLSRVLGSKDPQTMSLAAVATVTDLQPVLGFNRSIVKRGLEILNTNPVLGLRKLLDVAGRSNDEIDTYDLGWVIGPRLNASGRLVEAQESLRLLLEDDESRANSLAQRLNAVNNDRQDKTLEMYDIAADVGGGETLPKIIISAHNDYHEGVIGLVAARLTQKFYRPSIVISLHDGYGKGSVRSIAGVDIISLLREFEDLFDNLGGHPMAAGFTIKSENITVLKDKLLELAETSIEEHQFQRVLSIDLTIPVKVINNDLLEELNTLKPFGLGNDEPVFMSSNLGVVSTDWVGKEGKHLVLKLFDGNNTYKAIYFNAGDFDVSVNVGDKVDVAYTLKKNFFNGKTYIDLVIKAIKADFGRLT